MRFLALQYDIAWESHQQNRDKVSRMLRDLGSVRGAFVILPEMAETGFTMRPERALRGDSVAWWSAFAKEHSIWLCAGLAVDNQVAPSAPAAQSALSAPPSANVSVVFDPEGRALGSYRKVQPFSPSGEDRRYGFGDSLLIAQCAGIAISPLICYDLRFPELWRHAALAGAQVMVLGANWPAARQHHWRALCIARAIENQAFVLACNRTGADPNLSYAGGTLAVSPQGEVLAELGPEEGAIDIEVDPSVVDAWRTTFPALADARRQHLGQLTLHRVH